MKPQSFRIVNEAVRANALAAVGALALPEKKSGFEPIKAGEKPEAIWVVRIEAEKQTRTNRQNRYLWGVVYKTIVDNDPGYFINEKTERVLSNAGLTPADVVHAFCKRCFLEPVFVADMVLEPSTKKLDRVAFNDYVEDIRRWATLELQIFIPDPCAAGYADIGRGQCVNNGY